jgi:opacity protein-like surface antigen
MSVIRVIAAAHIAVLSSASLAAEKQLDPGAAGTSAPSAFYVGLNGGVTWAQDRLGHYSEVVRRLQANLGADAAFGSLHVSYQRGIDAFLIGLGGADYALDLNQGAGFYVDAASMPAGGSKFDGRSTVGGRLGYDFGDVAIYATGGGGWTSATKTSPAPSAAPLWSGDLLGKSGMVGAGVVYKFSGDWAAFSEYRYAEFAQTSALSDAGTNGGAKGLRRFTETSILAGATYRFR